MSTAPENLTVPQQALWWLKQGELKMGAEWQKAHELCQQAEGTFEFDLVHALAHWIEGDLSNRDYWYARVGKTWRRAETIELEWEKISVRMK
jgi:hypothetical protein